MCNKANDDTSKYKPDLSRLFYPEQDKPEPINAEELIFIVLVGTAVVFVVLMLLGVIR